jgi:hypothetical protein
MRGARAIGVAAVLVGVVVSASGCESAPDPPATASSSASAGPASPSASPSASATPSTSETSSIPAAAREKTPQGAEAFVQYFFSTYNDAWTLVRPGAIAALSHPECEFCRKAEDTTRTLASRGDRYNKPPVTVRKTQALSGAPEPQSYVYVDLVQNKSSVVAADGSTVHNDAKKAIPSNVVLTWTVEGWRVLAVEATA